MCGVAGNGWHEAALRLPRCRAVLVHSVEFANSRRVVGKAAKSDLGLRVISGSLELMVPTNNEWSDTSYELDPLFDENKKIWTDRSAPPDETFPETVRDLAAPAGIVL